MNRTVLVGDRGVFQPFERAEEQLSMARLEDACRFPGGQRTTDGVERRAGELGELLPGQRVGDEHAFRRLAPALPGQAQQRVRQSLSDALGRELADPRQRIGHVRGHLAHDVGADLRKPDEQVAEPFARPRAQLGRLHHERGDGIRRVAERDDAAERFAGTDETDDQLRALLGHLQQLEEPGFHQVEVSRRLTLPRQRMPPLQRQLRRGGDARFALGRRQPVEDAGTQDHVGARHRALIVEDEPHLPAPASLRQRNDRARPTR